MLLSRGVRGDVMPRDAVVGHERHYLRIVFTRFCAISNKIFSAALKVVALSLVTVSGTPRRPINRWNAMMKDDVVKLVTSSKCTRRVVAHVKMNP
ncbi:hypothetical protein L596_000474 [Steinernema carpocapsae]|uniref:Uncharacterized protein n=1 Tax=Steinernema carpocapsae TaxID=34508 RepID=A0A4U8UIA3_STECR|nr:hypothetical protein L596_000474 [Steinernema carpocapsae]